MCHMNNFLIPLIEKEFTTMQSLVQMKKSAISDPDFIGKSSKPNLDSFIEGSSDYLLWVYVNVLLKFEGIVVQN